MGAAVVEAARSPSANEHRAELATGDGSVPTAEVPSACEKQASASPRTSSLLTQCCPPRCLLKASPVMLVRRLTVLNRRSPSSMLQEPRSCLGLLLTRLAGVSAG